MFLRLGLFVSTRFILNIWFPTRNLHLWHLLGTGVCLPSPWQAPWVPGLMNFTGVPHLQLGIQCCLWRHWGETLGKLLLASSGPHYKHFYYSLFRIFIRTNLSQDDTECWDQAKHGLKSSQNRQGRPLLGESLRKQEAGKSWPQPWGIRWVSGRMKCFNSQEEALQPEGSELFKHGKADQNLLAKSTSKTT